MKRIKTAVLLAGQFAGTVHGFVFSVSGLQEIKQWASGCIKEI